MFSFIVAAALLLAAGSLRGADYYVSRDGGNGDAATWAAAWNELDQIDWDGILPGDVIHIDGGAGGMTYATPLQVGAAGTAEARLRIARSMEAGHDGAVIVQSSVYVDQPYVTRDGGHRDLFTIQSDGGGYIVRVPPGGDHFEFLNVTLRTEFQDGWGTPFYADCQNVLVRGCGFFGTNHEDQIKFNGGGGTLVIEDSVFDGLAHHGDIHEDVVQFDADGISLVARRNIFISDGTDCFMINTGAPLGDLEFSYNVFSHVADAIKLHSAASIEVYNNVFDSCRDILVNESTPVTVRNSIFTGTGWSSSGTVHITGYDTLYCLWDTGTIEFEEGEGNVEADPLFTDPDAADYHLRPGSPAINAGVDVGLDRDLDGNPIVEAPDIGAYEYTPAPPDAEPDSAEPLPDAVPDADAADGVSDGTPGDPDAAADAAPDDAPADGADDGSGEADGGCGCSVAR